jgi:hypothetical protein
MVSLKQSQVSPLMYFLHALNYYAIDRHCIKAYNVKFYCRRIISTPIHGKRGSESSMPNFVDLLVMKRYRQADKIACLDMACSVFCSVNRSFSVCFRVDSHYTARHGTTRHDITRQRLDTTKTSIAFTSTVS